MKWTPRSAFLFLLLCFALDATFVGLIGSRLPCNFVIDFALGALTMFIGILLIVAWSDLV
jgi:hypothetical protein